MIPLEVFAQRKFITFREPCYIFGRIAALCDSQLLKFVARQVAASVVIRAAKLKFVAESRTRAYLIIIIIIIIIIMIFSEEIQLAKGGFQWSPPK